MFEGDNRRQEAVHVARAEDSIGNHDGQKNLRCSGGETQVDVHVPQTGNQIFAATVDHGCATADSGPTALAHRRDCSFTDLDGHVGQQLSGVYVNDRHVANDEVGALTRSSGRQSGD